MKERGSSERVAGERPLDQTTEERGILRERERGSEGGGEGGERGREKSVVTFYKHEHTHTICLFITLPHTLSNRHT